MFLTIVGVLVAVLVIGVFAEGRRQRRSARGSIGNRVEAGNTQGHEFRTPPRTGGGSGGL